MGGSPSNARPLASDWFSCYCFVLNNMAPAVCVAEIKTLIYSKDTDIRPEDKDKIYWKTSSPYLNSMETDNAGM